MRPLNHWMSLAVRTSAMVSLVVSLSWTVMGSLGLAQAPLSGFLWTDRGGYVTNGFTWTD